MADFVLFVFRHIPALQSSGPAAHGCANAAEAGMPGVAAAHGCANAAQAGMPGVAAAHGCANAAQAGMPRVAAAHTVTRKILRTQRDH
jgi:hypothetical protein